MKVTEEYDVITVLGTNTPTSKMKRRANSIVLIIMVCICIAVIIKLFTVSVLENKKYEALANNYHFGTMKLEAQRGAIYDMTGTPLAWSATVYNVYIDPELFRDEMKEIDENNAAKISKAEEKKKQPEGVINIDNLKNSIASYLSGKLGIEKSEVIDSFSKEGRYYILKTQVEKDVADEIVNYFDDLSLASFAIQPTTKRYYPQQELASSVIGFTNGDGDGQYGIEYQYDEYLSGVDGRIISAQAANGEEMPYRYSTTYEAENGDSLHLTIDITLQYYLEKALSEMVKEYEVQNRACGIIMNPKTGAIYAMATNPSFDLNNPSSIYDETEAAKLEGLNGQAYTDAYLVARETQWKNKAISEPYIPGSVFKVFTSAAAFEEKLIDLESDRFNCNGAFVVMGETIHCSKLSGHGSQTFTKALTNSCNPAFMEIGMRLGEEKFSYYLNSFGLNEITGIDLPGEVDSICVQENMSKVDLASASFGQANKITPIQMITGYSAAINGGKLVTPYVVEKIVDSNGNIVKKHKTEYKRQVISEETSKTIREQLEAVVANNGGHNAYIEGYRIGGKSGTSEKLDEYVKEDGMQYVASYCCFAPADDPEIVLLMLADQPNKELNYYGSAVVVPYARSVMESILPYMGYYPEYTSDSALAKHTTVPLMQDKSITNAKQTLDDLELTYEVIGEGNRVLAQCPQTGTAIQKGGKILLYTEDNVEPKKVVVPNLTGMTADQANQALTANGLNIVTLGASSQNSAAKVQFQSEPAGSTVDIGTVVSLTMIINDQSG